MVASIESVNYPLTCAFLVGRFVDHLSIVSRFLETNRRCSPESLPFRWIFRWNLRNRFGKNHSVLGAWYGITAWRSQKGHRVGSCPSLVSVLPTRKPHLEMGSRDDKNQPRKVRGTLLQCVFFTSENPPQPPLRPKLVSIHKSLPWQNQ